MSDNLLEKLSEERKKLQAEGLVPEWYSTGAFQFFREKYEFDTKGRSVRGQFERIAKTAARHLPETGPFARDKAEAKFFELLWEGLLSPSTPVLANMGTNRGLPVSCSGTYISDSIDGFYSDLHEVALLTKYGFGTSGYLGDIRHRGAAISVGGEASGIQPVLKDHIETMRKVAQGTARRGAWAGYLPIDHHDFDEIADHVNAEPDDANIGWIVPNSFIEALDRGDPEATRRFKKVMKLKMVHGKGYFCFIDKINAKRPKMYVDNDLFVRASNLCTEITLFSDEDHTYTCVLSSTNVVHEAILREKEAVYWSTVFLDCVAEEFIQKAQHIKGLEKAVRFTRKTRALGLGQCGFHTLLQERRIPVESFEAHMLSQSIAAHIEAESLRASQDMAIHLGEPELCKGYGVRNTHRIAIAPTKSTAELMGGISEGINFDPGMTYNKSGAAGEISRINPVLLGLMKEKGVYTKKHVKEMTDAQGSVQGVSWLTDHEKEVFKTAFEINPRAMLRIASARGQYIDQWQSLNLFFDSDEDPAWISQIHQEAFMDPNILCLYYVYSKSDSGGLGAKDTECIACQ